MRTSGIMVICGLLMLVGCSSWGWGQENTAPPGEDTLPPGEVNLIDTPAVHTLEMDSYYLNFRFYQEGGVLVQGGAGLTDKLTIGASYGGVNVVGTGTIEGNPEPAFSLKYKLGEEGENLPFALSFGYDGQGYGKYYKEGDTLKGEKLTRSFYQTDSKGFYLVAGKRWESIHFGLHGGVNHSLKNNPGQPGVSLFFGAVLEATPRLTLKLEYNNGFYEAVKWGDILEDASSLKGNFREPGGELNFGLRILYTQGLALELDFKDLSHRYNDSGNRIFQITYSGRF